MKVYKAFNYNMLSQSAKQGRRKVLISGHTVILEYLNIKE